MDFRYLVKSGKYNVNDLKKDQQMFVDGMQYIIDDVLESFECYMIHDSEESTLSKIKAEIVSETVDELKYYIEGEIAEYIVCMADHNAVENE